MKVVNFQAENYQIIKAVDITPDGDVVTIGGRNGQGKSSILDAIWVAIVGRSVAPVKPIRDGEKVCRLRLDLGEMIVTRTFTLKEDKPYTDTIKVTDPDGKSYPNPQRALNALLGHIGFDPFDFVRMKADEQAATLLEMVPLTIDLEEFARADATDYARRTEVNREVAALNVKIATIQLPETIPGARVDREAILSQLGSAAETNSAIERDRMAIEKAEQAAEQSAASAQWLRDRAIELRQQAEQQEADAVLADAKAKEWRDAIAARPALADPVDTMALRQQLADAEANNAIVDRAEARARLVADRDAAAAEAQGLSDMMDTRENDRREALKKARMPIDGLGFDVDAKGKAMVIFGAAPFAQASTAEQIRASTAIAMAANPELRVLRIKDGSLLDDDSMAIIAEMAAADDWQIWIEKVGTGGVGFVIENGEVKGAEKPAAEPPVDEKPKPKGKAAKGSAEQGGLL